jgi:anti-sigma B factor antagonist
MITLQPKVPWLTAEQLGGVTLVKLTATTILDEPMVNTIGQLLLRLVDEKENPRLVLDFSQVERLTSTLFGKLILLHKKVTAAGGRLVLYGLKSEIHSLFDILRLNRLFNICKDEQEALQSFEG